MKTIDIDILIDTIAKLHKQKTGNENCLGSVKSTLKELFPSILEVLQLTTIEEIKEG